MKKIEVIELVKDYLSGGDAPDDVKGRFHDEVIANFIALAFNKAVFMTWSEAKAYSDYSVLDTWAMPYTINISDISSSKGRVLLPFPPVALPNAMGILQVSAGTDLTNTFAYRETNANSVFSALEVGAISTKPIFFLEVNTGDEINSHVLRLEKIPDGCTAVVVKMIVPFDQVDDYTDIVIPAGKEETLIGYVIEIMRSKGKEDVINDSKAN